jgi:hypothetical protein
MVVAQTAVADDRATRRDRWLDLANNGFVLLEPPDPRQHIDCRHLGTILDRLDCPCPRRWVRACELHGHCTIATVAPGDESHAALGAALKRIGIQAAVSCAECRDYVPDE